MFTWKPIYAEIAQRLCEFEHSHDQLVALMIKLHDQGLKVSSVVDRDVNDKEVPMAEIDPFSFSANFNRGVTFDNRKAILSAVKQEWRLEADLPQDFDGLPLMNAQNSWFMPYQKRREPHHVETLRRFYRHCLAIDASSELDIELFDACCALSKVAPASLTMGMFWSRPELWIAVDKKNREYAYSLDVTRLVAGGAEYLKWLEEVRQKTDKSTCEFSLHAHLNTLEEKPEPDDDDVVGPAPATGRMLCEFDELTANTLPNRILKSTCLRLAAAGSQLTKETRHALALLSDIQR